jgi:transcriptional regulator with XRE-family HTH domain
MRLALILKLMREAEGMTLDEVALRSGVAKSIVSRAENGLSMPRVDTFLKIINAMNGRMEISRALKPKGDVRGNVKPPRKWGTPLEIHLEEWPSAKRKDQA